MRDGRVLAALQVPTLHITSTGDVIRIPGYFSTAEDRIAIFDALSGRRKTLAVFTGGSHSMFTDRSGPGGPLRNSRVKSATRELTAAFLQSVYRGERLNHVRSYGSVACVQQRGDHPEASFERSSRTARTTAPISTKARSIRACIRA